MGDQAGRRRQPGSAVTIKDVARASGVAPATVTRVLNHYPSVRDETRDRVERAAISLGYRPDSIAQALVTRSTNTVGVLVSSSGDSFWGEVVASIEERAAEEGFSVLLSNTHGDPVRELKAIHLFLSRRVEGIIVTSTSRDTRSWFGAGSPPDLPIVRINWDGAFADNQVEEAQLAPVETVVRTIDGVLEGSPFEEIAFDDFGAALDITKYLLALGHRRIAFAGLTSLRPALLRYVGCRAALEEAGMRPWAAVECQGTLSAGRTAAIGLLSMPEAPTAVMAYDDLTAIGVIRGIRAMGRAVPDDISVVGFDDIEVAAFVEPPLTTVRQPKQEMGRLAMDLVLQHRGEQTSRKIHSLGGELEVRLSSRALDSQSQPANMPLKT